MGVSISDVMLKLKAEIDTINTTPLSENTVGLNNIGIAKQRFVNPDLLPRGIVPKENSFASPASRDDYANKVLQAVWNIAHHASGGYAAALWNVNKITESFSFLNHDFVPKIVDVKTYKVGMVLHEFLKEALTEESLANFPSIGGVREKAQRSLIRLQNILKNRIELYEAHLPDTMNASIEHVKIKNARRSEWLNAEKLLSQKLIEFNEKVLSNWALFRAELSTENPVLESDEEQRNQIIDLIAEHQETVDEFRKFNEQWNSENLSLRLPDAIKVSPFIHLLATDEQDQTLVEQAWLELYNSDDSLLYSEEIASTLAHNYRMGTDILEQAESGLSIIEMQKDMLEKRIADYKSLVIFERQLKEAVSTVAEIPVPLFVQELSLKNELIEQEDKSPVVMIKAYSALIEQLNVHQNQLVEQKKVLSKQVKQFEADHSLPKAQGKDNQPAFEQARNKARKELLIKVKTVEQQVNQVKDLTHKANRSLHQINDDVAKASAKGRKVQLDTAKKRVKTAFDLHHSKSRQNVSWNEFQFDIFINDSYTPGVSKTVKYYDAQILSAKTQLNSTKEKIINQEKVLAAIPHKANARREFLEEALGELNKYKEELIAHQGIYIPRDKIPGSKLKRYLEGGNEIVDFIDEIYKTEAAASSWYGFNLSNLYNKYSHSTTVFGPSDFDYDLNTVIDYISDKIELINDELKIDIIEETVPEGPAKPYLLGKENLWTLHTQLHKTINGKIDSEEVEAKQEKILQGAIAKKAEELGTWENKKKTNQQSLQNARLEHQINLIDHGLAIVVLDSYSLEYKVADIENQQKALDELLRALESGSEEVGQDYFESVQVKLAQSSVPQMMEFKENNNDSGLQLREKVINNLRAHKKALQELETEEQLVTNIPKELILRRELLDIEIKDLEDKLVRLDKSLENAHRAYEKNAPLINEKLKMHRLDAIKAMLETRFPALMIAKEYIPLAKKERDDLVQAIEDFNRNNLNAFEGLDIPGNPLVNGTYQKIQGMLNKLDVAYHYLRLDKIKAESDLLIRKYMSVDKSKRIGLQSSIDQHRAQESEFLKGLEGSSENDIQMKLTAIKENNQQLDHIRAELLQTDVSFDSPKDRLHQLGKTYFRKAPEAGIFAQYLEERASQFWLKDFFRSIVALTLGVFGYKTDAQEREEYLYIQLKPAFKAYEEGGDFDALEGVINKGQEQFSPRATSGEGYDKSLHGKLESLKDKLSPIVREIEILHDEDQEQLVNFGA